MSYNPYRFSAIPPVPSLQVYRNIMIDIAHSRRFSLKFVRTRRSRLSRILPRVSWLSFTDPDLRRPLHTWSRIIPLAGGESWLFLCRLLEESQRDRSLSRRSRPLLKVLDTSHLTTRSASPSTDRPTLPHPPWSFKSPSLSLSQAKTTHRT